MGPNHVFMEKTRQTLLVLRNIQHAYASNEQKEAPVQNYLFNKEIEESLCFNSAIIASQLNSIVPS